jgi:hypothetical protein
LSVWAFFCLGASRWALAVPDPVRRQVKETNKMTIQRFADEYKLKISRDDCGDAVICGKRGKLYVDAGVVCAMWTDATPMNKSRLAELDGTFWQGDIGTDAKGRRVQDAWVRGIRPEAYELAIRLVGAKRRRVMSPARWAALEKARLASPLIPTRTVQDGNYTA